MRREADVPIQRLIELVEAELLRTGYGNRVIKRYHRVWKRLTDYMKERSLVVYNTKIGLDFLEAAYQITVFKFQRPGLTPPPLGGQLPAR